MFFRQEYVDFSVVNISRIERDIDRRYYVNSARPYSYLSLCYDSDATIECCGQVHDVGNAVCYFPASMHYIRHSKRDNILLICFENHSYISSDLEYFLPKEPQRYRKLFEQALACWNAREPGYQYRTAAIVCQILAMAYEENRREEPLHPMVEKCKRLIEGSAFRKDYKVTSLEKELHVSMSYLRMLFAQELGISPKQYLLQLRVQKAVSLLKSGYLTVAEVAEQVGFSDPKHFSVQFKKLTGESPTQYIGRSRGRPV